VQDLIFMADTADEWDWLQQELTNLRRDIFKTGNHEILPSLNALDALLSLRQGDWESAWKWTQTARPGERLSDTIPVVETVYIRSMLAHGSRSSLDQGWSLAEQLADICQQKHVAWHLFEVRVLQALLSQARGETEQAFDTLAETVNCAVPLGFRQIFLQDGPPLQALVNQFVAAASAPSAPATWNSAAHLLAQANLVSKPVLGGTLPVLLSPPSPGSVQHSLSQRELEILCLLTQKLTNKEIGGKLFISTYTVRNHLVKIFDKLGANSRSEVLLRAREMGLLTPH
jgi:LuxR family transcriptional regulator, maltose regulon positive regulatory protein